MEAFRCSRRSISLLVMEISYLILQQETFAYTTNFSSSDFAQDDEKLFYLIVGGHKFFSPFSI